MINHLQPGQEALIELGQAGDVSGLEFGQEISADKLEETLDFAPTFWIIGRAQDPLYP